MTRQTVIHAAKQWAKWARAQGRMLLLAVPRRVECNACGWRGRRFLDDDWHRDVGCPKCGSTVRLRLLMAAHQHLDAYRLRAVYGGKRVMHVAPEVILGSHIRPVAKAYVRADYLHDGIDLRLDITDMPSIQDGAYDVLIACDVLEHVSDFRRAVAEIHRVLTSGGTAILTVPQQDGLGVTREDATLTTDEERRAAFGQHDHVRMFGDDFAAEVARYGFDVDVIDRDNFTADVVTRHRLGPHPSSHPLATNKRHVFFCRRRPGAASQSGHSNS
jgi:SAM-dependent methyltransferase